MKKLLGILGVFTFVVTPAATVMACGNDTTDPDTNVPEPPVTNVDLANDLSGADKEVLKFNTNLENEDVAKAQLKNRYSGLNIEAININLSTENKLIVTNNPNSEYYKAGSIEIIYTDPAHPQLVVELVLKQINLGEIESITGNDWDKFKEYVKAANPLLDVEQMTNEGYVGGNQPRWNVNFIADGLYKDHPRNVTFTFTEKSA